MIYTMYGGKVTQLWAGSDPAHHGAAARNMLGDEADELGPIVQGLARSLHPGEPGAPEGLLFELLPLPILTEAGRKVRGIAGRHLLQACGDLVPLDELAQVQLGLLAPGRSIGAASAGVLILRASNSIWLLTQFISSQ